MAVLDIDMPGMDGVEATLAIRAAFGADAPMLIALSGNTGCAAALRTLEVFDQVLLEPANHQKLLALLASPG